MGILIMFLGIVCVMSLFVTGWALSLAQNKITFKLGLSIILVFPFASGLVGLAAEDVVNVANPTLVVVGFVGASFIIEVLTLLLATYNNIRND